MAVISRSHRELSLTNPTLRFVLSIRPAGCVISTYSLTRCVVEYLRADVAFTFFARRGREQSVKPPCKWMRVIGNLPMTF